MHDVVSMETDRETDKHTHRNLHTHTHRSCLHLALTSFLSDPITIGQL